MIENADTAITVDRSDVYKFSDLVIISLDYYYNEA